MTVYLITSYKFSTCGTGVDVLIPKLKFDIGWMWTRRNRSRPNSLFSQLELFTVTPKSAHFCGGATNHFWSLQESWWQSSTTKYAVWLTELGPKYFNRGIFVCPLTSKLLLLVTSSYSFSTSWATSTSSLWVTWLVKVSASPMPRVCKGKEGTRKQKCEGWT